jgi:hypothetical protein
MYVFPSYVFIENILYLWDSGIGKQDEGRGSVPLSTERYGSMGLPAHTFLQMLATVAISLAAAALEVTMSAFWAGAN